MLKLVSLLVILFGVILVYDARKITKALFGYGSENDATMGFKMFGFVITIIGSIMLYILEVVK